VGKYTTAQWFAQQLLKDSFHGTHPDLLLICPTKGEDEKTSSTLAIRINQVRAIERYLSTPPIYAPFKVVIMDDAGAMTTQAANALLKTLEETRVGRFILIHHSHQPLLATIESRCQTIPFRQLSTVDVEAVLQSVYGLDAAPFLELLQGCPGILKEIQHHLTLIPTEVKEFLQSASRNHSTYVQVSKHLSSLERTTQIWLVQFLQSSLWKQCQSTEVAQCFESCINQLQANCSAQAVWNTLLGYWVTTQGKIKFPDVTDWAEVKDEEEPVVVFTPSSSSNALPSHPLNQVANGKSRRATVPSSSATLSDRLPSEGEVVQPKLFG
jgi:DNA polymerase III subunit delta'